MKKLNYLTMIRKLCFTKPLVDLYCMNENLEMNEEMK